MKIDLGKISTQSDLEALKTHIDELSNVYEIEDVNLNQKNIRVYESGKIVYLSGWGYTFTGDEDPMPNLPGQKRVCTLPKNCIPVRNSILSFTNSNYTGYVNTGGDVILTEYPSSTPYHLFFYSIFITS